MTNRKASASRAPCNAAPLLSSVDHLAAQAELDATLFPHYLLGRQLALEQVVRELVMQLPAEVRDQIKENLRLTADSEIERLQDGIADQKDEAATCGYVCTILQQGF